MATNSKTSVENLYSRISQSISDSLKNLLQEKHLYQSTEIIYKPLIEPEKDLPTRFAAGKASGVFEKTWHFFYSPEPKLNELNAPTFFINTPTIKIYCDGCKRIEPFISAYFTRNIGKISDPKKFNQIFTFFFQCQSCHKEIVSFMVKQKKNKFQLVGRSPIEHVEVKKYFPKEQKKYISNAVVAHQSGQTLAGLFFLRVFIEQFCVSDASTANIERSRVNEIIEDYDKGLPEDFKSRFPTLHPLYGKLSKAIHEANEDKELFNNALKKLEAHFDAKRLFIEFQKK